MLDKINYYVKPKAYVAPKLKKELFIVYCEKRNKLMYMFLDIGRKANRSKSWCVFINEKRPLTHKLYMLKLSVGKLKRVNAKLKRALNIVGERTQDAALKVIYTGITRQQILWQ